MTIHVGDWVEVRRKEEILATLDGNGRLDGLPLMPQMLKYCGQSFKVYKVAHKTCDTVDRTGGRRLPQGIHLDLRCDGEAYGGCQAACLLFWKEAWLKPLSGTSHAESPKPTAADDLGQDADHVQRGCSEDDVLKATSIEDASGEKIYQCQAVRLPDFTTALPWWRVDQYVKDYTTGNTTLRQLFNGFVYSMYCTGTRAYMPKIGRPGRWLYDRFQSLRGGVPYPRHRGKLLPGERTPIPALDLRPGQMVRVKSYEEILATLNSSNSHRGLFFDAELVPYCGGTYRVRARVSKFIDEKTGKMRLMKTPAVMLENVWCRSRYSNHRMFCPRSIYSWWREEWLDRVEDHEGPRVPEVKEDSMGAPEQDVGACGGCEGKQRALLDVR
jgi:hypothetical protein